MATSTFTMNGRRFIIVPEVEYRRLRESKAGNGGDEFGLPPLPQKLPDGNYPAVEYARAVTARDIIRSRRKLNLSQSELAKRSGVRVEVLNRIERAKTNASPKVMEKLDAVLTASAAPAEKKRPTGG